VVANYRLSAAANIAAVIANANGHVVNNLAGTGQSAGRHSVSWNGRTDDGTPLPDGTYFLMVNASGASKPSGTLKLPVRVDRTAPRLTPRARTVRAVARKGKLSLRVPVNVSEGGSFSVSARGGRTFSQQLRSGRRSVRMTTQSLGLVQRAVRRTFTVRLTIRDASGNVGTSSVRVVVPARVRQAPDPVQPQPPAPADGSLIWPSHGIVTSEFGARWGSFHEGMDIAAPTGTNVNAAGTGTVIYAGVQSGYGNFIMVQHANGIATAYGHLSRIDVVVGDAVARGQHIGLVGTTGHSTGPHLHFEVRVGGTPKNPRLYVNGTPPA
jgi:murein DD-endopeptidase MepM/ murein hydrolase activator NlpD